MIEPTCSYSSSNCDTDILVKKKTEKENKQSFNITCNFRSVANSKNRFHLFIQGNNLYIKLAQSIPIIYLFSVSLFIVLVM